MNNKEAILALRELQAYETLFFAPENSKERKEVVDRFAQIGIDAERIDLSKGLVYAIGRNISALNSAQKGLNNVSSTINKMFNKEQGLDEDKYRNDEAYKKKIDKLFNDFVAREDVSKIEKEYLEKEFDGKIYKIKDEHFEESVIPSVLIPFFDTFRENPIYKNDSEETGATLVE